jgi:hypothetical protein
MVELFRTNDLVLISAVEALLASAGIGCFIADSHMSAMEGSLGFLPRRVMVERARQAQARALVEGAGFSCTFAQVRS